MYSTYSALSPYHTDKKVLKKQYYELTTEKCNRRQNLLHFLPFFIANKSTDMLKQICFHFVKFDNYCNKIKINVKMPQLGKGGKSEKTLYFLLQIISQATSLSTVLAFNHTVCSSKHFKRVNT